MLINSIKDLEDEEIMAFLALAYKYKLTTLEVFHNYFIYVLTYCLQRQMINSITSLQQLKGLSHSVTCRAASDQTMNIFLKMIINRLAG